jgi:Ca2+-binding RTX toxin-like protein
MVLRQNVLVGFGALALMLALGAAAFTGRADAAAVPTCNGFTATIVLKPFTPGVQVGTEGRDIVVGSSTNDNFNGLGGDDVICAGFGDDDISGGAGNDKIFARPVTTT